MAMVLYPDAQRGAQQELDTIVGTRRLPEFSDRPSLPYINALVKELFRWHSGAALGLPHRVVSDDEYNGHLIPGGATVLVNMWFVLASDLQSYLHANGKQHQTFFAGRSCATLRYTCSPMTSNRSAS